MLSAIIIEDEKLAREVLISLLEQFFGNKINILGEASNVKQGISLIQKYQPQLVFLDIQLRGVTGFDLFNHFEEPRSFEVVFTTAHKEHAIKAIRSGAFDYILKPIAINDLSDMLNRLEVHLNSKITDTAKAMPSAEVENTAKQTGKLVIPTPNGYSLENKELIIYCEGMGNYTKIYLTTGKEMTMSKTLKTIELLLGDNFCRIHKSYLVNNNHILRYSRSNGYKITLTNDTMLDVSYRNNEKVLQILKKISH
ncbi:MAG: response regulator transcription factor [Saprospiraceae bacterium]|jgi:two-component system LytT family response regulator|nr:response regulator transcription factor [Saprospiraceae bacterium]MCF8301110.1 response regulator transcription factor [Haliscomenobacter sp.]